MIAFERACSLLERALKGSVRADIAADLSQAADLRGALLRLRDCMCSHVWTAGSTDITLDRLVSEYDRETRKEGFHVLNDWDGTADTVNDDIIPVDVLDFVIGRRGHERPQATTVAILLDYYFVHVLSLLSLRIWDDGHADANLDRLGGLLQHLQGPHGSGQQFAGDAETLMLIATSHFELEERGYHVLLERVRTLSQAHRVKVALGHAVSMGCHLRFGFEATYARDTSVMRDDNVADYPWLCFSVATLMDAYAGGDRGEPIVEGLLNGLSADARAFVGEAPSSLARCEAERAAFRESFREHRNELLPRFEPYRPSEQAYSPLSFFFNFSHNVVKGTVVDALLRGKPWCVSFNDLLTANTAVKDCPTGEGDLQQALAMTLMGYARSAPDKIRGRLMPVIVYDPSAGRQAFGITMRKLRT
jgi:hypothetical protein